MKKEAFFSKSKNKCPDDEEIARAKELSGLFDIKKGEELTQLYLKSHVIFLTEVLEKFVKVSIKDYGNNPFYCLSLPGYTYHCAFKNTGIQLQTLQDK